jgi:tRNA (guanine37-N1)-methyltransferase
VQRALSGPLTLRFLSYRDWSPLPHAQVDDAPFGGGAGMVMMPEPLFAAVEATQPPRPLLLLSAGGERFDQARARELAETGGFSLLCGRYEGVDQRVADYCCDGELSVGDYVLAGGEAAALVVIEAVTRLVPGVMGNDGSGIEESFGEESLVEYPQYTRPARYRDWEVPAVLRSGDHARVARWRRAQSLRRTIEGRPDLIARPLTAEEKGLLAEFPAGEDDR